MWQCRSPRMSASSTSAGSVPASGGLDLAAVLAQLRLDVGEPDERVELLLGRAVRVVCRSRRRGPRTRRGAGPCAPRARAARRCARPIRSGAGAGCRTARARRRAARRACRCACARGRAASPVRDERLERPRGRRARSSSSGPVEHDVEILDALGSPARRAGELDAGARGRARAARRARSSPTASARSSTIARARPLGRAGVERGEHRLLELRAEAPQRAQPLRAAPLRAAPAASRSRARRRGAARAWRPSPGSAGDRDQPGREARAQLDRRGDLAGLDQVADLLLERRADARRARSRGPRASAPRPTPARRARP